MKKLLVILLFLITGCSAPLIGSDKEPFGDFKSCAGKMENGDCIIIH